MSKHRDRDKHCSFWVTKEEKLIIDEKVKKSYVTKSDYLRSMALYGRVIHIDMQPIEEITRLLRIQTNNTNQIALKLNQGYSIYEEDIKDLQNKNNKLWDKIIEFMETIEQLK